VASSQQGGNARILRHPITVADDSSTCASVADNPKILSPVDLRNVAAVALRRIDHQQAQCANESPSTTSNGRLE
jgi:hypothetical protein